MKTYKKTSIGIKLSTTFVNRTKCRYCGSFDYFTYRIRNSSLDFDVKSSIKKFDYIKCNVKRMCDDYYLEFNPKLFIDTSILKHSILYKGYNPRLHRLKNVQKGFHFTEFVSCKCGKTHWAFNYKLCEKQASFRRKSSKNYPHKFYF